MQPFEIINTFLVFTIQLQLLITKMPYLECLREILFVIGFSKKLNFSLKFFKVIARCLPLLKGFFLQANVLIFYKCVYCFKL